MTPKLVEHPEGDVIWCDIDSVEELAKDKGSGRPYDPIGSLLITEEENYILRRIYTHEFKDDEDPLCLSIPTDEIRAMKSTKFVKFKTPREDLMLATVADVVRWAVEDLGHFPEAVGIMAQDLEV